MSAAAATGQRRNCCAVASGLSAPSPAAAAVTRVINAESFAHLAMVLYDMGWVSLGSGSIGDLVDGQGGGSGDGGGGKVPHAEGELDLRGLLTGEVDEPDVLGHA